MRKLLLSLLACLSMAVAAATREQIPVFEISTWNAHDAVDETPGFDRSMHHLEKDIFIPEHWSNRAITFVALGANQEVWLYVNGQPAGHHIGGYTAFSFDISSLLRFGQTNTITADITNAHDADIPPLSADFTFFGGFYRRSYLLATDRNHISTTTLGSNGIMVETPVVNRQQAQLRVTTYVNADPSACKVVHFLNGKRLQPHSETKANGNKPNQQTFVVKQPQLWSPTSPTLYTLTTRLINRRGETIDEVTQKIGFRYYRFDEKGQFWLNGEPLRLIGTNRHQCHEGMGWALPDSLHRRDMQMIKDMGANFVRISHYPQDPYVMQLCDSLGLLTSVEIPVVNAITETEGFTNNCLTMATEMVQQNRNHPSVILWGYMNEVLLRPPFKYQKGQEQRHNQYLQNVNTLSGQLNDRLHQLDSERYTFAAFHEDFPEYHRAGLDTLADVIGHNIYAGWYSAEITDLEAKMTTIRQQMGNRPMLMSEYGADCDARLRSTRPARFDYTTDYALLYHRHYLHFLLTTDMLAGGTAWNFNDFHSEPRGGAIPHINCKGLVTTSRVPKFTYYYYQSVLSPDSAIRRAAAEQMNKLLEMPQPQQWPLCILLGSNRYYTDRSGLVWQPDDHIDVDGEPYRRKTWSGDLPASDVTILGTHDWPIYQTARMALTHAYIPVPDGEYEMTLCWAELETPGEQEMSPYNLGNKAMDTGFKGRLFTIQVNGRPVSVPQPLKTYQATDITLQVTVRDGQGIRIEMQAQQGATILNALKITPIEQDIITRANHYLALTPLSVMDKKRVAASGDRHDYLSQGRYLWPDTNAINGLPYVTRDGLTNPEIYQLDREPLGLTAERITVLAQAWQLSHDERYAQKAAQLLRTWFIDPDTRMNPHLSYAQICPGQDGDRGRCYGLIDTYSFVPMVQALPLLESSDAYTPQLQDEMKRWFSQYLDWMLRSKQGKQADRLANNHSIAYDAQVVAYALFSGRVRDAQRVIRRFSSRRLMTQFDAQGWQPHEIVRTLSFHYTCYNIAHVIDLLSLAQQAHSTGSGQAGISIPDDEGMHRLDMAIDQLEYYAEHPDAWPYEQISGMDRAVQQARMQVKRYRMLRMPATFANAIATAVPQYGQQVRLLSDICAQSPRVYAPRTIENEHIRYIRNRDDWTVGFFAGSLWYLYQLTGDDCWREAAMRNTQALDSVQYLTEHHDIGFMMGCSYGNALRLTGDTTYPAVLLQSARSLATRFRPHAGIFQSWNEKQPWIQERGWWCPTIIDNMMNLELMFEATRLSGDSTFWQMAVSHADTTMAHHFRANYSCYHLVDYDTIAGGHRGRYTVQGFADESTWSRGHAWAVYGYTVCYRYTHDKRYLEQAQHIVDYLFTHSNMPEDLVPYWDLDAPDAASQPRDASAAAILASALYEMADYQPQAGTHGTLPHQNCRAMADRILTSLCSPAYLAPVGSNGHFLLMHSVGNLPNRTEVDVPLNYADYYFLEALARSQKK